MMVSLKTAFNVNHPCTNGMDEKSIFLLCVVGSALIRFLNLDELLLLVVSTQVSTFRWHICRNVPFFCCVQLGHVTIGIRAYWRRYAIAAGFSSLSQQDGEETDLENGKSSPRFKTKIFTVGWLCVRDLLPQIFGHSHKTTEPLSALSIAVIVRYRWKESWTQRSVRQAKASANIARSTKSGQWDGKAATRFAQGSYQLISQVHMT